MARHSEQYFTGKPCVRGHIDWRLTSGRCKSCARENKYRWRRENPEAYKRQYDAQNAKQGFQQVMKTNKYVQRIDSLVERMNESQKTRFARWLLWKPHHRRIQRAIKAYSVDCFLADYGEI